MINVAVYADGLVSAIGMPNLFFKNEDFIKIINSRGAQQDLIAQRGEGVCIGCLGILTPEGYVESEVECAVLLDEEKRGDLSFYEKLL